MSSRINELRACNLDSAPEERRNVFISIDKLSRHSLTIFNTESTRSDGMSDLFKDIATPEKVDGNRDDGEEQDAAMKSGKSTTNMLKGSKASPSSLLSSPISAVADPSAIPSSPVEDTPSRPKRKRGAPSRYSDEEEKRRAEAAIASTARPKRRRGGKKINFDASYLLEAKNSVLTRIDLRVSSMDKSIFLYRSVFIGGRGPVKLTSSRTSSTTSEPGRR